MNNEMVVCERANNATMDAIRFGLNMMEELPHEKVMALAEEEIERLVELWQLDDVYSRAIPAGVLFSEFLLAELLRAYMNSRVVVEAFDAEALLWEDEATLPAPVLVKG